jgi:hypothetical protein
MNRIVVLLMGFVATMAHWRDIGPLKAVHALAARMLGHGPLLADDEAG